ncbi:DUF3987 domain-containing protein [Streptomyces marispadix]|uniref:DUF3987 domain-containing protein n=1 Tax=Streptomyces marispadix TaxID=2922868 RepID=UPI0027E397DB|nr:DUF3987 domain-containing protein [Streptomyces marispadix]
MSGQPHVPAGGNVLPFHGAATDRGSVPCDLETEQAVLGSMMLAADVIADVQATLSAEDYYRPAHETVHRSIAVLHGQGKPVDPITLTHHLGQSGDLHRVGGPAYVHGLVQAVPTTAHAAYYAEIVHELAERRRLIQAGTRLVQAASTPEATADEVREAWALGAEKLPEAWSEPIPLTARPQLPRFPLHALPSWLGDFCAALAEETQTPPDMDAALALSVLATAAGGRVVVRVRGRWLEPTNLYVVVALPPANRKSAVFSAMTGPLYEAEKQLANQAAGRIVEAELTRKMAQEAADKAAARASSAEGPERDSLVAEAIDLAQQAEELTVPPKPRLLADDSTPETVTSLMAEQGGRLAVMSAEGGIFDIIAGRYSGAPNMEVFLKGHAGDRLKVDRRNREEFMEAPALTMGLAVQPSVLEDIGKNRGFDGRGLLARFLYALPESLVGYRKIGPEPVPESVAARYERNVTALTLSLAEQAEPYVLQLTADAGTELLGFEERVEPQLRARGGKLGHVGKWAGKLVGTAARIAGLLHVAAHLEDGYGKPIEPSTMSAAIEIADYFADHALTVFDLMGADAAQARAQTLLEVLRANAWETVSRRDLFAKLSRSEFPTVADLEPAVALLEEHGYLRSHTPPRTGKRGRPPAPRYLIHPQVREGQA